MLRQGYSLDMLQGTCETVHGGVRLGGLGTPNILHMPFHFKPRGIKKYSISYMVQIELIYISIKSGFVNSNVDVLFWQCHGPPSLLFGNCCVWWCGLYCNCGCL